MKLNLNLPYKKLPKDSSGDETKAADLTRLVLIRIMDTKYPARPDQPSKMPSNDSRMWGKVLDEFAEEKDTIEIDGSQFDFLKEAVEKTDLPPGFSSWLWVLREHFEEMKKEMKDQKGKEKDRTPLAAVE
jgi:hypothetical protein